MLILFGFESAEYKYYEDMDIYISKTQVLGYLVRLLSDNAILFMFVGSFLLLTLAWHQRRRFVKGTVLENFEEFYVNFRNSKKVTKADEPMLGSCLVSYCCASCSYGQMGAVVQKL